METTKHFSQIKTQAPQKSLLKPQSNLNKILFNAKGDSFPEGGISLLIQAITIKKVIILRKAEKVKHFYSPSLPPLNSSVTERIFLKLDKVKNLRKHCHNNNSRVILPIVSLPVNLFDIGGGK